MARAVGGPDREKSKDNERSARQAGGEKIIQFLNETNSQRILRTLDIPLSVRLSRGGNRTTGTGPADRPRA
ncbi:hypothetical protein AgCh_000343 [Apium graveolens]